MKQLPQSFQNHLNSGATTLCWCWRLTRNDGIKQGFTDHDRDLTFDATTFSASTGFTASEMTESLGLNVDNMDVGGVLQSGSLDESDLAAGLYDNARVEIFRVNWVDVSQRVLMKSGSIGEVKRGENAFTAEIRGMAHELQQPKGRIYQYGCDASLGDERCGVNLSQSTFRATGAITQIINERTFEVSGLTQYQSGWFASGLLNWTSGVYTNRKAEVKFHTSGETTAKIELWRTPGDNTAIGDTFEITAGCDKQFATCRTRFDNATNFRGCPHMPGNDFALSYPNRDDGSNNGGRLTS